MRKFGKALLTAASLAVGGYFTYVFYEFWKAEQRAVGAIKPTTPTPVPVPPAATITRKPSNSSTASTYQPRVANAATYKKRGKRGAHPNPWKGHAIGNGFFAELREQRIHLLMQALYTYSMKNHTLVLPTYPQMAQLTNLPYGTLVQLVTILRERNLVERHNKAGNRRKWRLTLDAINTYGKAMDNANNFRTTASSAIH